MLLTRRTIAAFAMTVRYVAARNGWLGGEAMDGDLLEPTAQRNPHWRAWILRAIGVALVLKLVALVVIKSAFFSAAREPEITPRLVDDHLAVEASAPAPPATETTR
jgi:hypothetical protein